MVKTKDQIRTEIEQLAQAQQIGYDAYQIRIIQLLEQIEANTRVV